MSGRSVITRTCNRDCRSRVQNLKPFNTASKPHAKNGTIFARWTTDDTYVVYSYGEHWPLHVCIVNPETQERVWFSNEDKHSRTTSKHYGQAHPLVDTQSLSLHWMDRVSTMTYPQLVEQRLLANL